MSMMILRGFCHWILTGIWPREISSQSVGHVQLMGDLQGSHGEIIWDTMEDTNNEWRSGHV